jgi:hypothetical protein
VIKIIKYNLTSDELQGCVDVGFDPVPFICECIDGQFLWDNDVIRYVRYNEDTRLEYEWKHSKHIIPLPLRLDMTSDELMEICLEAGQRPIRHQVCQCTDGDFIWDEDQYKYIPYNATL